MTSSEATPDSVPAVEAHPAESPVLEEDVLEDRVVESNQFLLPVALVGAVIVGLGVSGLFDDSGVLDNPWWTAFVLGAALVGLTAVATTVRTMRRHAP